MQSHPTAASSAAGAEEPTEKFLNIPPPVRNIQMEVENYERLMKESETSGRKKNELGDILMDLVAKKDLYRVATQDGYTPPLDVTRNQKNALIKIFYALQGFGWKRNFGWIGQDKTLSRPEVRIFESDAGIFDGVTVGKIITLDSKKGGHGILTKLDFSGIGSVGELTQQFGEFEFLKELLVGYNLIEGSLPSKLKLLERLEVLSLQGNRINGTLDATIFNNLSKLKILNVSFNSLTGSIPDIFDRLVSLEHLNLSGNQFSGYIPPTLGELKNIKTIMMHNNNITGFIPEDFKYMTTLEKINLSRNKLEGGIRFLLNNINMQSLVLSYNVMDEDLPVEISKLTMLTTLYLHNNKFRGIICPEWCKSLLKLKMINLSNNDLHGIIPEEIGLLKDLASLIVVGNRIKAPLPKAFADLKNLKDFTAFTNYPAHLMKTARAFSKHRFARMHVYGPKVGLDNVHFSVERLYGPDPEGLLAVSKRLDLFPLHKFNNKPDHTLCFKANPDFKRDPDDDYDDL